MFISKAAEQTTGASIKKYQFQLTSILPDLNYRHIFQQCNEQVGWDSVVSKIL